MKLIECLLKRVSFELYLASKVVYWFVVDGMQRNIYNLEVETFTSILDFLEDSGHVS